MQGCYLQYQDSPHLDALSSPSLSRQIISFRYAHILHAATLQPTNAENNTAKHHATENVIETADEFDLARNPIHVNIQHKLIEKTALLERMR